jgi:hypothetical protein
MGHDLGVGADQDGAVVLHLQGGGGRRVQGVDGQRERSVEAGRGGGPGAGVRAGEEGEAGAQEVPGRAAARPGEPDMAETAIEVVGQGLSAVWSGAFLG